MVEDPGLEVPTLDMTAVAVMTTTLLPDALDAELLSWPAERVAEFAIRAAGVARIAAQAKRVAEARLREMEHVGDLFRDPVDQRLYRFTGGRHRKVKDVAGLIEQLSADGVALRDIAPWLASGAIKVGKDIRGSEKVAQRVEEWATWSEDLPSLIEIDEQTMKLVRR